MNTTINLFQLDKENLQKSVNFEITLKLTGDIDQTKLCYAIAKKFLKLAELSMKYNTKGFKRSKPVHFELVSGDTLISTDIKAAQKLGLLVRATKKGELVNVDYIAELLIDIIDLNNFSDIENIEK